MCLSTWGLHRLEREKARKILHRLKAGWLNWRSSASVLCDRCITIKFQGKFCKTAIKSTLLYGAECWAPKKQNVQKMVVTEMQMLKWIW
ncbi:HECT-type E3 ubiquitin transferase [Ranunculus cassubicifolius]